MLFLDPKPLARLESIYIISTMLPSRWSLLFLFLLLPIFLLLLYFLHVTM